MDLEITIISGQDLRINGRRSVKKNCFVVIGSDTQNMYRTELDGEGGIWNQKLVLKVPSHAPSLTVDVRCKAFTGDRLIGRATIPISDFSGEYFPDNYLHFLSYRLRDRKGEPNGIINLSIRVKGGPGKFISAQPPHTISPAVDSSGFVTDYIPVWNRYQV